MKVARLDPSDGHALLQPSKVVVYPIDDSTGMFVAGNLEPYQDASSDISSGPAQLGAWQSHVCE